MASDPLFELVGAEIDTVSFVRDYSELRLDDAILRALTDPTGIVDGEAWRLSSTGGAEAMRRYIGCFVSAVEVEEDERITLLFSNGDRFDISLRHADRAGAEAAHFVPASKDGGHDVARMQVF